MSPLTAGWCALALAAWTGLPAQASGGSRDARVEWYEVGSRPGAIAVADFDGDGHSDVAVANTGGGSVTILLGNAKGRLAAPGPAVPCGPEPSDIAAADIDRDGDADLVVAHHETSRVSVLLNDGAARFRPAPGSPFDSGARPHVHGLAIGDFDADGWIDVAVDSADTREVRILPGGPRGLGAAVAVPAGTMPYHRLGAADVTGDGIADVLVPGHSDNTVRLLHLVRGRLALSSRRIELAGRPWKVAAADVTGDGRKEVVVVESDRVSIWLAGPEGFPPSRSVSFSVAGATEIAAGDLDGDGIADVAIGPWDASDVTVVAGGALAARTVRVCRRPIGLAVADLDGDGRGELLAACATEDRLAVVRLG